MASTKKFVARKDFMLECGHAVKQGEEFVITSVFTCEHDKPKKTVLGKRASWVYLLKRQLGFKR